MNSNNSIQPRQVRHFMVFAIVLIVTVGSMILAFGSAAQSSNVSVANNSNMANGNMRGSGNGRRRSGNTRIISNVSMSNNMMSNGNMQMPSPSPTPKSSVRGRVVYENTGRPVRRAAVVLLNFKGGGRENSGLTDNNGLFEIKNVSAGKYFPMINAPGVVTPFAYFDVSEISADEARQEAVDVISRNFEEITVNGETDTEVLVRAKQGGAIGGRVFYADGDPAIGVKVEVMRKSEDKFLGVITSLADLAPAYLGGGLGGGKTDDRGVYRIAGLPPGDYVVRVSEPATHSDKDDSGRGDYMAMFGAMTGSLLTTYHPNASDAGKADVIKLELGQEAAEVNIAIPERGSFNLSGKIVAHGSRQPVKNAKISLQRKDSAFSLFDRISEGGGTLTDETGAFAFKDLPAGTYIIKIKPPYSYDGAEYDDEGRAKPQGTPKPRFAPTEKEFTIEDKDLSEMTIEMPFGSRITGAVTVAGGKQLPNSARITATDEKGESVGTAYISGSNYSDGAKSAAARLTQEFSIENIAAGKINLDFTANPFEEDGKNNSIYYLKSITLDSRDLLAAPLEVRENSDVKTVQILLGADGGRLKAKVKQKDSDEPAVSRTVVLIPIEENKWKAKSSRLYAGTNTNGEFEAAGAPGEYFVFFLKSGDKISVINDAWIRERSANAEKVTMKANETATANLVAP